MKNNYPIRYVALPLSEKGVWKSDSEQVHGIICYLVVKCYVVGEETKFLREGYSTKEYKVVPTYGTILPQLFEMTDPKYDEDEFDYYEDIEYTNSLRTRNVFEKLEDAEKYRDERNKEIVDIVVSAAPKWANLKEKFEKTVEKYKELETDFEKNTKYLPIDESKRSKQTIYGVDDGIGLVDEEMSVYSLMDAGAYDDESYAVYTITKDEAKELAKIEADDDAADAFVPEKAKKFMHTLLMTHGYNRDFVKLISPSGESQIVALGEEPFVKHVPKALQKSCDPVHCQELFFTTETYDEIVESYNLDQKRKRSLNLKLKPEDIWTNDRYKY